MLTTSLQFKKKVKGCFFDLDGTLEDTSGGVLATVKHICQTHHIPYVGDDALRPFTGEGLMHLVKRCQPDIDQEQLELGFASGLSFYRQEGYKYNHPFPGVKPLLEFLNQNNITWGIVTNKVRSILQSSLDQLPILPKSDLVICADDLPKHKPDPMPILEVCRRGGVSPCDSIFIGDSVNDMRSAAAAGVYGVFVTYGFGDYNLVKSLNIKTGIINHLDELQTWLTSTS
ncbi:HAD family hydrolase [Thiotrichales bacterium 19S11-10]|nr:HAD family hydrolase [Thiotrichales bacterium 19S11-10]MCF6807556.1 HAD family hydrolase [Thiotrichales bacterium 19S9-11]MCF6811525.1 HAD family hydrolase [Thiotrichales bacterium 19S9-12]